jgi:squalene synthase HpnC
LEGTLRGGDVPATVRAAFAPVAGPAEAEAYTRELVRTHYENFSVVSRLLPKRLRQDFCNVYAFCRVADDLGDEVPDRTRALELLGEFRQALAAMYAQLSATEKQTAETSAVFTALRQTVQRHNIPIQPFDDLIRAFEQDQTVTRYQTWDQVVDYCTRSADPVGRIVLYMCGYRDDERQRLSDRTCTALQLVNFWQDVRRDILERDRIYLPAEAMQKHSVTEEQIRAGTFTPGYAAMMRELCDRTEGLFSGGKELLPRLEKQYRKQIALFGTGGLAILHAIRRQNYDTLTTRPRLSKWQKMKLIAGTLLGGG